MVMKAKSNITCIKTKIAFLLLCLPVLHVALCLIFTMMATWLEQPCDRDGIYLIISIIDVFLWCLFPGITIGASCGSFVMQILALRRGESKVKNILMMVISILYCVVTIIILDLFLERLASV